MATDLVEHTPAEAHCEYCGAPLSPGASVVWDERRHWMYCSTRCVERDQHFRFHAHLAARPDPSLEGLTGLLLGEKRDGDVAVVLMERADGVQIAIGFEKVTYVLSLPAPNARVTGVRRRDFSVIFDFESDSPARLAIRAAGITLVPLS